MASKKTSSTPRKASPPRKPSTRRRTSAKRTSPQSAFPLTLRPEHQRELFALALITLAALTLTFFLTGVAGGVGTVYVAGVQQLFGSGALGIPLMLGVLGIVILVQERLYDTPLTGANILGTLVLALALLLMLEFPAHAIAATERPTATGGGWIGYGMVSVLDLAIGRPAAVVVSLMLLLVGGMLAFNLSIFGAVTGLAKALSSLFQRATQRSPERAAAADAAPPDVSTARKAKPLPPSESHPPAPPAPAASEDEIVTTPIAARPTRASLFQRPEAQASAGQAAPPTSRAPEPAPSKKASEPEPAHTPAPTTPPAPAAPSQPVMQEVRQDALEGFDAPTVYRAWPLPSMELLERPGEISITSDEEHRFRSRTIEETLKSFKVEVQVVGVNTGPAVTQFEVQPAVGVKISKITALQRDLALALAAPSIRIEAPIPGKSVVGIEIPNSAISVVTLREVIDSEEFEIHKGKLRLPLGKDISGNPIIADMTRMPHLLVAGSTGSGKSVAINAFLCGLLLKHTPEDLKLIMVDPKMVELIVYNHIPHLLSPVVTELERVVPTLKWATREMERRYKVFARYACRNLESYRQLARRRADLEPMPYIVIVIDELADLMMMAPDEVETYICRLAQMARATGIHLIIATQRPSVDVITGLIKANFPSRIAFAVSSQVDSRVILDSPGAEQLLGRGDMLFMAAEASRLVRIQGTYVSDREVEKLVNFWRAATPPELQDAAPAPVALGTSSARAALPDAGKSATAAPSAEPDATQPEPSVADQSAPHATPSTPQSSSNDTDDSDLRFTPPTSGYLTDAEQETLLPQALVLVRQHRRASAALLQRRLRIGHSKAAQLIDLLEQMGVVGPADEGRSREVLPPQDGASG